MIISKREYSTRGGGEANYLKSKRENRISKKALEKKKPVMISAVSVRSATSVFHSKF